MKRIFNSWKKYIPNILTTLRLFAVPVFWVLTLTGNLLPATILFGSACVTDALDGYLARRWKVQSIYGKITDPFADKMLVMSSLLLNGITVNQALLIPFILESGIAIVNVRDFMKDVNVKKLCNIEYIKELVSQKNKVKVSQNGRIKTIFLMSTVSLGLLNSSLNLSLEKLVSLLIMLTGTMESATLVEYIDAKVLNKTSDCLKIPDFVKNDNVECRNIEKTVQNNDKDSNIELSPSEKIEKLKNEKLFLNTNSKENKNSKIKNFKIN